MTPKEKAEELYVGFWRLTHLARIAKQCALIAVDEILNAVTTIADKKYDYFIEVKREIEKL